MALYAFDGTWNTDSKDNSFDTNVVRFVELYNSENKHYIEGIGTRLGIVGKLLGGVFGVGGRTRVEEMTKQLAQNWEAGDEVIDVIGFSRGAALAVHFTNELAKHGLTLSNGQTVQPRIRFLGLWDNVASFGLSFDTIIKFNEINLGWDVDKVSSIVDNCFHAMALDERRESFGISRLNKGSDKPNIKELWFRGVHADIGGGNGNFRRSNIALHWMLGRADETGLPIDFDKKNNEKYKLNSQFSPISENKDIKIDKRRTVEETDIFHPTAMPYHLQDSQIHKTKVQAEKRYNWSGVSLEKGKQYKIEVIGDQTWEDGGIDCTADGWKSEQLKNIKELIVKNLEPRRRCPDANWFELVGSYGDSDERAFRIGANSTITATMDADLYLFANDLNSMYDNNQGTLEVTIQAV